MIQEKATPTDNANAYLRGLTNYCAKRCCFEAKLPYEYSAFATGLMLYIGYKNINVKIKRQNKRVRTQGVRTQLVPVAGVEPARYRYHWILSPARLPIPSRRQMFNFMYAVQMVLVTGLEPVRYFYRGILSPLRLPVPPRPQVVGYLIYSIPNIK